MFKYLYKLKIKVIKYYLENKRCYVKTAKYFNIKLATRVKLAEYRLLQ